jgi:hypothetical protein
MPYRAGSGSGASGELLPSANGIASDQTSVIHLHSAKCKRTIPRHSDVGVFEWGETTNWLRSGSGHEAKNSI